VPPAADPEAHVAVEDVTGGAAEPAVKHGNGVRDDPAVFVRPGGHGEDLAVVELVLADGLLLQPEVLLERVPP
jgi:hypothetical protein